MFIENLIAGKDLETRRAIIEAQEYGFNKACAAIWKQMDESTSSALREMKRLKEIESDDKTYALELKHDHYFLCQWSKIIEDMMHSGGD